MLGEFERLWIYAAAFKGRVRLLALARFFEDARRPALLVCSRENALEAVANAAGMKTPDVLRLVETPSSAFSAAAAHDMR